MSRALLKSTSIVTLMTMISRIFGFVRDITLAIFFGTTGNFDAFIVAFKIPNFMRRLFAEGSFSQAFVPILSEYQSQKPKAEIERFLSAMAGTLTSILLVVTILGVVLAPAIVRLFAMGFDTAGPRYELAVTMLRITFPYLMLISLTAFSGAILNTYSRFWVAAFTPVFLNICMISAAIWLAPQLATPIIGLAWGVFIAGVVQLLFQWPFLRSLHLLRKPTLQFRDPGVQQVLKLMIPALFGVSVSQINLLLDTVFASFLAVGSVSWLYYADRLMEFPLGVFRVAISTVILPHLSRHYATRSLEDFSQTVDWALRCILLIGIPAGVMMAVLAGPLLSTLFQHGIFNAYSVIMVRKCLIMFAIGITPFMIIKILAAGFYARKDIKTPVKIGIIAMISNMVLNMILIWPLAHAGIALATSLAAIINMSILYYFLRKKAFYIPSEGWRYFIFRLVFANCILGMGLWAGSGDLQWWLTKPLTAKCIHLLVLLMAGIVIYLMSLWLAGIRPRDILIRERPAMPAGENFY